MPTFSGSILTSASNLQAEINSETEQKEEKLSNPADEKVFFFNLSPHKGLDENGNYFWNAPKSGKKLVKIQWG